MRQALILIFLLFGIDQAVAGTAKDLDEISKVGYCYGALTKWQLLVPIPAECNKPNPSSAICQTVAKDARKIDQLIAYLTQHMFNSNEMFKASETAQDRGETEAINCKKANPGMTEPHCPQINACLTMNPPR